MAATGKKNQRATGRGVPVQVRVWLPLNVLADLDATAERSYCSRSVLAAELLRAGLGKARRHPDVPADVAAIAGNRQRAVVAFRKRVLDGWRAARAAAKRRRDPVGPVTAVYIQRIKKETGQVVSRRSLYLWDRRHAAAGLLGLMDGRSVARTDHTPPQSSNERSSKAVRETSKPG